MGVAPPQSNYPSKKFETASTGVEPAWVLPQSIYLLKEFEIALG